MLLRRRAAVLSLAGLAVALPVRSESLNTAGKQLVAGIVVVSAGVAVGITLIILHEKHKLHAITGCVMSAPGGMNLKDEKDNRIYSLIGDPVGIKAGDRMTLQGRRQAQANNLPVFQARSVTRDFGACQP